MAMCRQEDAFPDFLNYHCMIHQLSLCAKMLNMKEIMATKIIIIVLVQGDLFKDDCFVHYSDLFLHSDVRWLGMGEFVQRF